MNVTEVVFNGFYKTQICGLYQYDYGQVLKFTDITLPSTYEVHFAQSGASTTVTVLGDENGVQIPDQYLLADLDIRAYIYLHEEETDGETVYQVLIPVIARPEPTDVEPTPVEQDIITQTIAALNSAVDTAEDYAADASQSASDSAASAISAQAWAEAAQESAESIDMSNYATKAALQSEESARALADTSLGNQIGAEVQRATQAEASIRLAIPSKTSQLQNDSGYITNAPVASVNGKTGAVSLTASDVGALPSSTAIPSKTSDLTNDSHYITASEAPVQSVNGQTGAVTISAEGLSEDAKNALIDCFRHVAWIDSDGTQYVNALISALYELQSITAVYTQSGTVYDTDSLDDLKTDLVVTANYKGDTTETVTAYTLSGTLAEGTSTITVSYGGKTTTFDVSVTHQRIPSGYTEYDYLKRSSKALDYVVTDLYNDPSFATLDLDLWFETNNTTGKNASLIGCRTTASASSNKNEFGLFACDSSKNACVRSTIFGTPTQDIGSYEPNVVHHVSYRYNSGSATIAIDDSTPVALNNSIAESSIPTQSTYPLALCGVNSPSVTGDTEKETSTKFGKFVFSKNGETVYEFVPVYNGTKYGYYELINGVFYPQGGSVLVGGNY